MKIYPRGSEWRKWDLHVHVPGTKLNNGYGVSPDWDLFCRILEESDVVAFGITDYFSADAFYEFATRYKELYPNSEKVFFPNIELRLNETVNGDNQDVNLHLIFRPDVPKEKLELLLRELKTEITDGNNRNIPCSELATEAQYRAATVTRTNLRNAFENTFGKESAWSDNVIVVVPANNDGIRPPSGAARKANLADQIDKGADALFGHSGNTDHFLKTDRFEDASQLAIPKPVFAGCDAHSFDELEQWLGKQVEDAENRKQVTWIKADLTFEGLQQTLVEPAQRVRIQAVKPDARQPYQYIAKVRFSGTGEFPEEVLLNQNLVSVIGTRSSGKSALLAYIAHAVDPHYAVAQQVATRLVDKDEAGPAAGKTWDSVSNINCSVEWGDPAVETGKVIYIPQNSLYAISERPEEITAKIQPALYRLDSKFAANHRQAQADVEACNTGIRTAVARWFSLAEEITNANRTLRDLGDKKGVVSTRNSLAEKIAALRESASLSETEMATYQELVTKIAEQDSRVKKIVEETELLSPYLSRSEDGSYAVVGTVGVNIDTVPAPTTFPEGLQQKLLTAVEEAKRPLLVRVGQEISAYQAALDSEAAELRKSSRSMREDNVSLIEKYKAHAELDSLVQNLRKQEEVLAAIDAQGKVIAQLVEKQSAQVELVKSELTKRQNHLSGLVAAFSSAKTTLDDGMSFGIETDFTLEEVQSLSRRFNVQNIGLYVAVISNVSRLTRRRATPFPSSPQCIQGRRRSGVVRRRKLYLQMYLQRPPK